MDLRRVTVNGSRGRFDIALPATVPIAYLLPGLLRQAGEEAADAGAAAGGWVLQRLGGWPFDTGRSPAALGIADGDVLYLRPRRNELPPPVLDDADEAIGWTLAERTRPWDAAATRVAGLVAVGVLLVTGLIGIVAAGPPWGPAAALAGGVAVLMVLAAGAMSRAIGDATSAGVLGCAAAPYAFLTGCLAVRLPQDPRAVFTGPQILTGASLALVSVALAAALVGGGEPILLTAVMIAGTVFLAAIAGWSTSTAGGAAVAVAVVFIVTPTIPTAAYRLARLPAPFLPVSAEDLRRGDATTLPAHQLSERTLLADRFVTALVAGFGLVVAGGSILLTVAGGWPGVALTAVVAGLTLLRTRVFVGRPQRGWLLGAGMFTTGQAGIATAVQAGGRAAGAVAAVAALACLVAVFAVTRVRSPSPVRARLLDMLEMLCAVAIVPLVLELLGGYTWIRSLFG